MGTTQMTNAMIRATSGTPCQGGDLRGLERTRFFPRQLVSPDDLTQDQIYFREKAKRHNRMLHGWGVVCGACVRRGGSACEVIVEPGYLLGPYGDEIVIDKEVVVDICKMGAGERDGCCGEELDPWCGDARSDCAEGTLYLAVRYSECMARPVHAGACGCGCDESDCEYSRIRDSFTLKVLRELPSGYATPMPRPSLLSIDPCRRDRTARNCPPCPTDPWVILADVAIGRDCAVRAVNCFTHRRYVVSFADFFFTCPPGNALDVGQGAHFGIVDQMRMMAMMTGTTNLMDTSMPMPSEAPRASVALTRADGSAAVLPAYFTVQPGTTVADLLVREGDRVFYDPMADRTYSLREIYTSAGVSPATRLAGTTAALSPLEGHTLGTTAPAQPEATEAGTASGPPTGGSADAGAHQQPTGVPTPHPLHGVIDPYALARLGETGDAGSLPATAISGVSASSALGKRIADMTVAQIGAMSHDDFLALVRRGAPQRRLAQLTEQATQVWQLARRATGGETSTS
jgi:hypothetical protein